MNIIARMFTGLGVLLFLSACSGNDTCESVVERINEIEQELDQNPESLSEHTAELQSLGDKMEELKCHEAILDEAFPDR
jgi:predicted nuclease with TOPRIM domain